MTTFKVLSVAQTREMDRRTIEGGFVSGEELMQRAGVKIAMLTADLCKHKEFSRDVLLLAGKGNNGGDVFVAARILQDLEYHPTVLLTVPESALQGDALYHYQLLKNKEVAIDFVTHPYELEMELEHFHGDVIVDGLLGTGFQPPISDFYKEVIQQINQTDAYIIAVDIPSGLDASGDTPIDPGAVIHADITLTIGSFKTGFLKPQAIDVLGRVIPVDIGFPQEIANSFDSTITVFTRERVKNLLRRRARSAHKGCFGHVLLIGGCPGYTGAIAMAGRGALRSGAGLVSVGTHPESRQGIHNHMPEMMTRDWISFLETETTETLKELLKPYQTIGIGPGLGRSDEARKLLKNLLQITGITLVLDADALNLIAEEPSLVDPAISSRRVFTPHPGEASRLLQQDTVSVEANRIEAASQLAEKFQATIILKGAHTLVLDQNLFTLHLSGTPAMAQGGMGDVLTGMVTSFLAQEYSPFDAANLAVSLHGQAAEKLENEKGPFGFTASECADQVPLVVHHLGRLAKK